MSKVIVMKYCCQCPHSYLGYYQGNKRVLCSQKHCEIPNDGIPDWCPLPDTPEKKYFDEDFIFTDDDYATIDIQNHLEVYGWNKCCDYLLTGKDELEPELEDILWEEEE